YIKLAADLVNEQYYTEEEKQMIDRAELAEEDRKAQIYYGIEQGRNEGREEGRNEGRAEGRNEGRAEKGLSIAKSALAKGLSPELVAEITGLDLASVKELQSGPEPEPGPCQSSE
ncbi:MAG: hypothetical protein FWH40_09190, partial [Coriobacteriia bacterium]|nr:hypothetical protein [Coriobacteriia bacterium]